MKKSGFLIIVVLSILTMMIYQSGMSSVEQNSLFKKIKSAEYKLPVVGTIDNLKKLLASSQQYNSIMLRNGVVNGMMKQAAPESNYKAAAATGSQNDNSVNDGFSKTNVQVEGVDEADIVKTEGVYIYQITGRRVIIAKAVPADKMKIIDDISFDDKYFNPMELYVDSNYLVVIGEAFIDDFEGITGKAASDYPVPYNRQTTRAVIYNIANKNTIKKVREVELEGNYIASRKIGTKLYIASNMSISYYPQMNDENFNTGLTPYYRDTAKGKEYTEISCDKIQYFPDSVESSFLIVGTFDIGNNDKTVNVSTYLGSGQNVYMSMNNLYVAVTKFSNSKTAEPKKEGIPSAKGTINVKPVTGIFWPGGGARNTLIYKFALTFNNNSGLSNAYGVSFVNKCEVPGTILNQFSMDENDGSFRIATTEGDTWGTGVNTSKNNLYVLNGDMKITGKLEGMATGEKIYSVRFIGDRAYVVTFKKVDPLFVIDLKDVHNPRILGALKIPGYSDYLQPYDENHIIGIGKDTVELPYKDGSGNTIGTNAFYLGIKIAIFDVSDVKNPREKCHETIGDRGTYSPVLNDHKALLFSKEKNLLAFPVTVYKLQQGQNVVNNSDGGGYVYPEYGSFDFQGAYIYNIDLNKGFTLKGRITHLTQEEQLKTGMNGYEGDKEIKRILFIKNMLYTTSDKIIKATSLDEMKDVSELGIK